MRHGQLPSGTSSATTPTAAWRLRSAACTRESWIADEDFSRANHGISGPGAKDHVKVYEDAIQSPSTGGDMTICLRPDDEIGYNATANDRGDARVWTMGCWHSSAVS